MIGDNEVNKKSDPVVELKSGVQAYCGFMARNLLGSSAEEADQAVKRLADGIFLYGESIWNEVCDLSMNRDNLQKIGLLTDLKRRLERLNVEFSRCKDEIRVARRGAKDPSEKEARSLKAEWENTQRTYGEVASLAKSVCVGTTCETSFRRLETNRQSLEGVLADISLGRIMSSVANFDQALNALDQCVCDELIIQINKVCS